MNIDEIQYASFGKVSFRIVFDTLIYRFTLAHESVKYLSMYKDLRTREDLIRAVNENQRRVIAVALRHKNKCFEKTPVLITKSMVIHAEADELVSQSKSLLSQ